MTTWRPVGRVIILNHCKITLQQGMLKYVFNTYERYFCALNTYIYNMYSICTRVKSKIFYQFNTSITFITLFECFTVCGALVLMFIRYGAVELAVELWYVNCVITRIRIRMPSWCHWALDLEFPFVLLHMPN